MFGKTSWQEKTREIEGLKSDCEKYLPVIDRGMQSDQAHQVTTILERQLLTVEQFILQYEHQYKELIEATRKLGDIQINSQQREDLRKGMENLYNANYEFVKTQIPNRAAGSCRWVMEHQEFRKWLTWDDSQPPTFL